MNKDISVIELRQYTLHPGKRDTLLELFEQHFTAGQEASGIRVLGQFRDANDPNRFVWVRGFRDMASRAESLKAFYGGPIWKTHRDAANATMVDSDDVLLLRPVGPSTDFPPHRAGVYVATICLVAEPIDDAFLRFFEASIVPVVTETGAPPIARMATEYAANNFSALPVRAGEHAFVWFAAFASNADYERHLGKLRASKVWNESVEPALRRRLASPAQALRLEPAGTSSLAPPTGDVHDFDFLAGTWSFVNRRLVARGCGCTEWNEFGATSNATLHLGGIVNVDENDFPSQGWSGMTIRAFNLETRQWSIYWVNSRQGTLMPPVVGGFVGARGEFFGDDHDDGRPVKVVFTWTKRGANAASWQQAFSYDGGKTWEINWVMEFTRTSQATAVYR